MKLELVIKEMIRLNIKPNFSALAKENDCDYRTIKKKYEIQILKEKGIEIIEKSRDCLIDDYRNIINYKLETIPGIKAMAIYYFIKVEKGYNGSYSTVRDYVNKNQDKRKKEAVIRVNPIIGKAGQVDWKEDFKLINNHGEVFIINLFLLRLHYSKKFYSTLTIDKKRDEVKKCIVEAFEYFGGIPKELWFDNMKTVVDITRSGGVTTKSINNEIKQFSRDLGFNPITCQSRRAKTKGTVENMAKLVDRLLSYNEEFETLEDLQDIVYKFNEECGKEKSQAHNKIVNETFNEEKEYLLPLPNENILLKYKQPIEYRKVSNESMVVYRGNKYSVPTRFINSYLGLRIIDNQVYIYDNTELVRCHKISNEKFNYNNDDKLEILKSDLLFGKSTDEIQEIVNSKDLEIYDFLKGGN
ncbi:MAG: IS21 family transposase [Bacilli bacterium]